MVSFFKLGLWLIFAPGFDRLLDDLVESGKKVFLDAKMFDIGETVKQGVARAAERGVSFVTVHGDDDIIRAAVEGKGGSDLKILVVPVLTSLDEAGLRELGYDGSLSELIVARAQAAWSAAATGSSPRPGTIPIGSAMAGTEGLLVVTPGVRLAGSARRPQALGNTGAGDRRWRRLSRRRPPDRQKLGSREGRRRNHRRYAPRHLKQAIFRSTGREDRRGDAVASRARSRCGRSRLHRHRAGLRSRPST